MSPKAGRRGIKFAHPPSELPVGHLPGNEEVGAYFYYILNANPKMATSEICHVIESDLIKLWSRVDRNLPLLTGIFGKISNYIKSVRAYNNNRMSPTQRNNLEMKRGFLFDIAACQCELEEAACSHKWVPTCHCISI